MMELIEKKDDLLRISVDIDVSLANAIRRSVAEVMVLAVDECDFYKNDSALYDEIIAHRIGLIPLKNQKLSKGEVIELKLKAKGKEGGVEVMSGEFGDVSVYDSIPIIYLDRGQEIEIVAKARVGIGLEHAKFMPGLVFYRHLPKIKITSEGESLIELSELFPKVFSFDKKLQVKDASMFEFDSDDLVDYKGVLVSFDDKLVFVVESWGQMSPKDILLESCKALRKNLGELSKEIK